jgi:ubiquitin C-terminal hydrolase
MTALNKLNKGIKNNYNSCFMNVVLQSLIATPPFFNLLQSIGKNESIMESLGPESLLRNFVILSKYFDPNE